MAELPNPESNGLGPLEDLFADWSDGHPRFADRRDAGRRLAAVLGDFRHETRLSSACLLAGYRWPRRSPALGAPFEVVGLRAIAAPEDPDYELGVLAEGDVTVIDREAVRDLHIGTTSWPRRSSALASSWITSWLVTTPPIDGSPSPTVPCCSLTRVF